MSLGRCGRPAAADALDIATSACPWQRCTVHFLRDMVMHCRRDQRNLVAAALREVFNAEDRYQARERVTHVLERLRPLAPKVSRPQRKT
jgi:transposase-like protein